MTNLFSAFILSILIAGLAFSQVYKGQIDSTAIPKISQHYQDEYTFDLVVDSLKWQSVKPGMNVSFASTNKLYFRSEVPDLSFQGGELAKWEATGWKGERLNTSVLVWAADTLRQVRFILTDLVNNKGQIIPKKNLKLNLVKYVLSNYPYAATDITCGESPYKGVYLMPDRFEKFERFEVPGRSVRPVWLSVDIPSNTKPGDYEGTVEVKSENYSSELKIKVTVQNQVLPQPKDWSFRLDLWQNPWVIAWYYNLEPWSDEHMALLKEHMKLYADAGGKFITTYAVHSPWADNSYMIEGAMIDWTKLKNGSWKFDYSIFDKYVQLAIETGIDDAITIYTPVPWGNRFRYMDENTGNYVYVSWAPDSTEFIAFWNVFLTDLKTHLKKKGWFNKTYLGINENEMSQTLAAINVVKNHSKDWKITYAGNWHQELDSLLDDYSFLYGEEPEIEQVKERSRRGATSTYYICCNPAKPNNFVFSPPAEGRWLGWYSAAYSYDGFLRWAYDAWPADPMRDARHTFWAAGDCFLVYPGANSGIRFEKLREGISDFEKMRILRKQAAKSKNQQVLALMQKLDQHLSKVAAEEKYEEDYVRETLNEGLRILDELSVSQDGDYAEKKSNR